MKLLKSLKYLYIVVLTFIYTPDGTSQWRLLTLYEGGEIRVFTIDPTNTDYLWFANSSAKLYMSTNGGTYWEEISYRLSDNDQFRPTVLSVDPTNANVVYAAVQRFLSHHVILYKTTDKGLTWDRKDQGIQGNTIKGILIHHGNANFILIGTWENGIYHSSDGGDSWSPSNTGLQSPRISAMAMDPQNANNVYIGVWITDDDSRLYKSTDAGSSWTEKYMTSNQIYDIAISPSNPDVIALARAYSGAISHDGGETWLWTGDRDVGKPEFFSIAIDATNPNILYDANVEEGLFKTTNGGTPWISLEDNFPYVPHRNPRVYTDPYVTGVVYASTYAGMVKSENWGDDWTIISNGGLPGIGNILIDHSNSDNMFVGGLAGVLISTDAGEVWKYTNSGMMGSQSGKYQGLNVNDMVQNADDENILYASTQYGIFKSLDKGNSWQERNNGLPQISGYPFHLPVDQLVIDSEDSNTLFTTANVEGEKALFKSMDAGINWILVYGGDALTNASDIIMNKGDSRYLYSYNKFGMTYGISRSSDSGVTWEGANEGLPDMRVRCLAHSHQAPNALYAGIGYGEEGYGIWKSTDHGSSWQQSNNDLSEVTIFALAFDRYDANIMVASTYQQGIWESRDRGMSWIQLGNPNQDEAFRVLSLFRDDINDNTIKIYAGGSGLYLFERDLSQKIVAILYPNQADIIWKPGETQRITWSSVGDIGPTVKIDLFKGNTLVRVIEEDVNNSGNYDWIVPTDLEAGSDYKIKISSILTPEISDISDQFFTIQEITMGTVHGTIYINYDNWIDETVTTMALPYAKIALYLDGKKSSDSYQETDQNGYYVFDNVLPKPEGSQVYIQVTLDGSVAQVKKGNKAYDIQSEAGMLNPGTTLMIDCTVEPENENYKPAFIHKTLSDAWEWFDKKGFDPRDKIRVTFPYRDETSEYDYDDDVIHIHEDKGDDRQSILYAYGYAVLGAQYDTYPELTDPQFHRFETVYDNEVDPFIEGWALFTSCIIDNSVYNLRALNPESYMDQTLEKNEWYLGDFGDNDFGERVAGAIASILWDIFDDDTAIDSVLSDTTHFSPDERDDDDLSSHFDKIWSIFKDKNPVTIKQFYAYWLEAGYDEYDRLRAIYTDHGVHSGSGSEKVISSTLKGDNNQFNLPFAAVGPPDGVPVALGLFGEIILDMGVLGITDVSGSDLIVYEANLSSTPLSKNGSHLYNTDLDSTNESFLLFVSEDSISYIYVGAGTGTAEFDISETGLSLIRYIKILDDGDGDPLSTSPGYDLDAVESITETSVPQSAISHATPSEFRLSQNFPNPFNAFTTFNFRIPKSTFVTFKIYNLMGEEIESLLNEILPVGAYQRSWHAKDLPSGIYLYRLEAGVFAETRKLILQR